MLEKIRTRKRVAKKVTKKVAQKKESLQRTNELHKLLNQF